MGNTAVVQCEGGEKRLNPEREEIKRVDTLICASDSDSKI